MKNKLILLLVASLLPTLCLATIYQWTDAQGQTQYGQEPPANVEATVVKPKVAPASTTQKAADKTVDKTAPQTQPKTAEKEPQKPEIDPKVVEEMAINCERAKVYLKDIESKPRIRLQDASGNVNFLTDEERNQEIVKTKAAISKFCVQYK
ncbi:MAG: DUF4124 domain-containing protein [Proteobacteria bacterium]|nr:DUF4124 domain-containing protein [Pseudomonadota bacterium]